jgi:hypothetical protein
LFNIKWGLIAGVGAFILSLAVGLLSGAGIFFVMVRALIFTGVFFLLGAGGWLLINSFMPELLYADSLDEAAPAERPGSRVNITLGGGGDFARPEMYQNSGNSDEVGNISDLISGVFKPAAAGGMDQQAEKGYTYAAGGSPDGVNQENSGFAEPLSGLGGEGSPVFNEGARQADEKNAGFTVSFGSDDGLGGLPDLDAMSGAFLTNAGVDGPERGAESSSPSRSPGGGKSKSKSVQGDFNPKELAAGIRTVLSKDK